MAEEKTRRVAEEIAPREVEAGSRLPDGAPLGEEAAVDENRPGDLMAQAGESDLVGASLPPNLLQRPHALVPHRHRPTPGELLAEETADEP